MLSNQINAIFLPQMNRLSLFVELLKFRSAGSKNKNPANWHPYKLPGERERDENSSELMHRTKFRHTKLFETFPGTMLFSHSIYFNESSRRQFAVNNLRNRISTSEHVFIACNFSSFRIFKTSFMRLAMRFATFYPALRAFGVCSSVSDLVCLRTFSDSLNAHLDSCRSCSS